MKFIKPSGTNFSSIYREFVLSEARIIWRLLYLKFNHRILNKIKYSANVTKLLIFPHGFICNNFEKILKTRISLRNRDLITSKPHDHEIYRHVISWGVKRVLNSVHI